MSEVLQRTDEWLSQRRGIPTASCFDQIVTAVKGEPSEKGQRTLINRLIAESIQPPEPGGGFTTPEMEHGIEMEPEARSLYELEYATEPVTQTGFILADSGLYGGSPDSLVGDCGILEIKCPKASTHVGYTLGRVLPSEYRLQCEGYLVVTKRDWLDFMSYRRGFEPFIVRLTRSDFTKKLENELINFAQKYNEARKAFNLPPIGNL
jgi:hypothetical protein